MILMSVVMLFFAFLKRHSENPWWLAVGVLLFLGGGAVGVVLICVGQSFEISKLMPPIIVGTAVGAAFSFVDKLRKTCNRGENGVC